MVSGTLLTEPSETTGDRQYCERCRGELTLRYENQEFGDLHAVGIGLLDQPELVRPTYHQFVADMLPWLDIRDALPRFQGNEITHPRDRPSPFSR
jgi:hypothetical protein